MKSNSSQTSALSVPVRIKTIDVFRALTMFLMLFVNDIPGLRDIPHWLGHAEGNEDMMGFADTIFPAFLFVMGVSIPFAIQNRFRKGESLLQAGMHILWRTVALVIMGLFTVNWESIDASATGMSGSCFAILMVIGFFLIWAVYPKVENRKRLLFLFMRIVGVALLFYLFWIYKGSNGSAFGTRWWGILGLIGWTYLVSALVYLIVRQKVLYNFIAWIAIVVCMLLNSSGKLPNPLPGGITLHAFGITGVLVSVLMQHYGDAKKSGKFFAILAGITVVMLIGGIVSHDYWIISKIRSTPTWYFYCIAMFLPLFILLYWLCDIRNKSGWFAWIRPAGTVTLTCYMIPYLWYSIQSNLY